jgi:anti-sigma factor RsiW
MTCERCREMADSYLADELPVDTTQEVITHLETCSACCAEVEARQRLRRTLREAFSRSASLAPDAEFLAQVRARLEREHTRAQRRVGPPAWLAMAASVIVLIGIATVVLWNGRAPSTIDWARLAAHAAGDHRYCAFAARTR